ncbi:methyltransferase family protein [Mucilaginibacter yixingensis]|uniref:Methyltransferase family protein n=1 Tax=Mucilaginibacter yixingensis TaxID=1295612 RepID=A0A2T5J7J3_9SPHI|nr:class I SAM-dependent methyltransferase [Mucilaginibacter yixingensis]PTQ95122.1 methyltransferase family protein [Mucilaginibacter yixingensis]
MLSALKHILPTHLFHKPIPEKEAGEAYNIWSVQYDAQPANLMMDLDEQVFGRLLDQVDLTGKSVADIGCGTGRHWAKMLQHHPVRLAGFDVSAGMLERLRAKFGSAETHLINDNLFSDIPSGSFDVIVSTLTMAHIQNLEEALLSWSCILKQKGDILITDFHPDALATGGKRTFKSGNQTIAIKNFVHHVNRIIDILAVSGFEVTYSEQIPVDESMKHYYEQYNALHVYEKFEGMPMIYGLHLQRK